MNEQKWTTHRVTMPDDKALEYLDKLLVVVNEELLDPGYAIALSMAIDKMRAPLPDNKALTVEELREMDGEPVWVNSGGRVFSCIVQKQQTLNNNVFAHGFHDYDGIRLVHDVTFTFMASDVECYRRPPEKGE